MLWATLIMGLASIATASIRGGLQYSQTKKANTQAQQLANIQRQDEQFTQSRANRLAKNDINLRDKQLTLQENMFGKTSQLTKNQEQYQTNVANTSKMRNSVQSLLQQPDENWLYKGKVLGRFSF